MLPTVALASAEVTLAAHLGVPPHITTTDTDGRYAVTLMNTGPGGRDVLVRVYDQASGFTVRSRGGATHRIQSSLHVNVPDGTLLTVDLTANDTLDNHTAFSVRDALVTAGQYIQHVHGAHLSDVDIVFPAFGTFPHRIPHSSTLNRAARSYTGRWYSRTPADPHPAPPPRSSPFPSPPPTRRPLGFKATI